MNRQHDRTPQILVESFVAKFGRSSKWPLFEKSGFVLLYSMIPLEEIML
jgi:hypothetical protein